MQNRFKSKVVWASIVSQILILLVALDVIDTGMSAALETASLAVLEALVAFGILNNPSSKDNF